MNKPNPTPSPWAHELWAHLHTEHGLTLTESELDEIIRICRGLDMGGGITAYNFGTRCATIEDVNALLAMGMKGDATWNHTVRRFCEKDGVASMNPDYTNAPFGIIMLRHEDGRSWAVGVKLGNEGKIIA